jgi:hypothetical protein
MTPSIRSVDDVAGTKSDRLRIVVLGYIVRGPVGGMAWCDLHYLIGLRDLGHDVYYAEDSGDSIWCCYDPSRSTTDADPTYGLAFTARELERIGFGDRWAYYDAHTDSWRGPCASTMLDICATADLVLNPGGVNLLRPWFMQIPVRVLIDKDPAFTQVRHITDPSAKRLALRHTAFFTLGENIGHDHCTIPDDGLPWQPTRHPIAVDAWPATPGDAGGAFTTVMLWDSYRAGVHHGLRYGLKSDSFTPFLDLPNWVSPVLELAVGGATAPRSLLADHGWKVTSPLETAVDPSTYQRYIQQSKAEFTVAKHGYVVTGSGWFSERSASYLASGRPVVTQDTGFPHWLNAEEGVLPFGTLDNAIARIADVTARYEHHCRRAREIAIEYFDARKVLRDLIERSQSPANS